MNPGKTFRLTIPLTIMTLITVILTSCASLPKPDEGGSKAFPSLSPDGTRLVYVAPYENVMNVWVQSVGKNNDRVVTKFADQGTISYCCWALNGEQIICTQRKLGPMGRNLYAVSADSGEPLLLNPDTITSAYVIAQSRKFPDEVLITMNEPFKPDDIYRVNTRTGEQTLVFKNDINAARLIIDNEWNVIIARMGGPDEDNVYLFREDSQTAWDTLIRVAKDEVQGTIMFNALASDDETAYIISLFHGLQSVNIKTKEIRTVASSRRKIREVMLDPETAVPLAVCFRGPDPVWQVLDEKYEKHLQYLEKLHECYFRVVGWTGHNRLFYKTDIWIVRYRVDNETLAYYYYDPEKTKTKPLFSTSPILEESVC